MHSSSRSCGRRGRSRRTCAAITCCVLPICCVTATSVTAMFTGPRRWLRRKCRGRYLMPDNDEDSVEASSRPRSCLHLTTAKALDLLVPPTLLAPKVIKEDVRLASRRLLPSFVEMRKRLALPWEKC